MDNNTLASSDRPLTDLVDLACLIDKHDRNAIADGIGKARTL